MCTIVTHASIIVNNTYETEYFTYFYWVNNGLNEL